RPYEAHRDGPGLAGERSGGPGHHLQAPRQCERNKALAPNADSGSRTEVGLMKTAITGGAGFIGSHLVEYLLAAGDEVVVLDDLSTGRLENLKAVIGHRDFHFVEGSILDRKAVDKVVAGADRVFHLAAAVGVNL